MAKRLRTSEMNQDDVDRISKLPDHIRYHILSFLPLTEAIKASLLSKTWRDGWINLPCLDFSKELYDYMTADLPTHASAAAAVAAAAVDAKQFLNVVDQALTRRSQYDHSSHRSVKSLKLYVPESIPIGPTAVIHVNQWIDWAVDEFRVKELDIFLGHIPETLLSVSLYKLLTSNLDYGQQELSCLKLTRCEIVLPVKTSWRFALRILSLRCVMLHQEVLDSITTSCPLIESLDLFDCYGMFDSLNASDLKRLVSLKIHEGDSFKRIEIDAPNLKDFDYHASALSGELWVINLGASKRLKNLSLCKAGLIVDDWLNCTLAELSELDKLYLEKCHKMEHIRISSTSPRNISVINCMKLEQIEINAPGLEVLHYKHYHKLGGSFPSLQSSSHALSSAMANFDLQQKLTVAVSYEKIMSFLVNFNGFQKFQVQDDVVSILSKGLMSPLHLRKNTSPPLYNVKHLIINYNKYPCSVVEFISTLLLLSPHPETISISSEIFYNKRILVLKFKYKDREDTTEKCDRCKSLPVRCWQHCLEELTIVNKGVDDQENPIRERIDTELKTFFQSAMTWEIPIHINSGKLE